jgi:signal transduction histidine kinase
VRVALARAGTRVLYTVHDDGPGVMPDERESIFEPGVRGTAGSARSGAGGAGLGLALARRLARTASGEVDAQPSADGGRSSSRYRESDLGPEMLPTWRVVSPADLN